MPVVGFIDANGEQIRFADIEAGKGDWGFIPPEILLALSHNYRSADHYGDESVISATTIVAPVQITHLLKRHEVFVDGLGDLWSGLGTAVHALFEANPARGDIAEVQLVADIGGQMIGGTFDLLRPTGEPGHVCGKDYKITSVMSAEMMAHGGLTWNGDKADYFWQAQIYKRIITDPEVQMVVEGKSGKKALLPWPLAGTLEVDGWDIITVLRNWTKRTHGRKFPIPIASIPVPILLENDRIDNYLNQRITLYKAAGMCEDKDLPNCTVEETWEGRRCKDYCAPAGVCHQLHPGLALL